MKFVMLSVHLRQSEELRFEQILSVITIVGTTL